MAILFSSTAQDARRVTTTNGCADDLHDPKERMTDFPAWLMQYSDPP